MGKKKHYRTLEWISLMKVMNKNYADESSISEQSKFSIELPKEKLQQTVYDLLGFCFSVHLRNG